MREALKKATALLAAFTIALPLAACGGETAPSADTNAGIADLVFCVPDSWTMTEASKGDSLTYKTDSDYVFGVSIFDEEDLEDDRQYDEENTARSVQEYFEQTNTAVPDDELKKSNVHRSEIKVCDTDAYYYKGIVFKGPIILNAEICKNNKYYHFYYLNYNNYDEEGRVTADAVVMTDEEKAEFDAVIESIREGDGNAVQMSGASVDSVGSVTFEVPKGYTLTAFGDGYASFDKDDSEISLSLSTTTEEDLQLYEVDEEVSPTTLSEEFAERNEFTDGGSKTTIAGFSGYKEISPEEDGKYYSASAEFLGNDAIYSIYMDSDAWDWEGEIRRDAENLTQDDIAVFEQFIKSIITK